MDRSHLGRLLLTGADRRAYLQGLLTNDIDALTPGTGCYAALLTARGRMVTDMRVVELGDAVLIDLPARLAETVRAHLDRFVFSEDVQVADVTFGTRRNRHLRSGGGGNGCLVCCIRNRSRVPSTVRQRPPSV